MAEIKSTMTMECSGVCGVNTDFTAIEFGGKETSWFLGGSYRTRVSYYL